jgi:hypothetical protein
MKSVTLADVKPKLNRKYSFAGDIDVPSSHISLSGTYREYDYVTRAVNRLYEVS